VKVLNIRTLIGKLRLRFSIWDDFVTWETVAKVLGHFRLSHKGKFLKQLAAGIKDAAEHTAV
jgi:hypothetical protein